MTEPSFGKDTAPIASPALTEADSPSGTDSPSEAHSGTLRNSSDRLLTFAKAGHPQAIAGLLARKLYPYGISIKSKFQSACLELLLESSPIPDQRLCIMLILGELVRLQIPGLVSVRLFARQTGHTSVAWTQILDLQPTPLAPSSTPCEISAWRDRVSQADLSAMKALLDRTLAHKQTTATLTLNSNSLDILLEAEASLDEQVCLTLICREVSHWNLAPLAIDHLWVRGLPRHIVDPIWEKQVFLQAAEGISELRQIALGNRKHTVPAPIPRRDRLATPIDAAGWKTLAASFVLASLLMASQQLTFLVSPLLIIVHELGHASLAWLFGYAALPAFDFMYGGGITMQTTDRIPLLLFGICSGFAYLCYRYRHNDLTSRLLLGGAIAYGFCALTQVHTLLIVAMGHGFELLFAGIFLYRALSGWGCRQSIERPLYGMLGLFTVFYNVRFAYRLLTDAEEQGIYQMGKGNLLDHDFVRLAIDYFNVDLSRIVTVFLICTIATPIVTFLLFRYRVVMLYLFSRLFLVRQD
ncbi:MAG: hypothetical protein HY785_11950 [Oscillatoriophycideae cyanobacterium NC_groundwater_1537_Pr4_S-0.65um_50_18]|nr:hypothetical protein [Oscillatoriophycideae cyanobacterium NC_groundwater_1537_Pr4_S-0.65um_50_18]